MKLIDKAAVVVEIEKIYKFHEKRGNEHDSSICDVLYGLSYRINTIEVKEVDFEKELNYDDYINFFNENPDYNNRDWGFEECWVFAKHFFELGLKTMKEE